MASQKRRQAAARQKQQRKKPMKFTFKNIGPVKKAELELGNLTIIAGRNNTGKTYIAHTLYAFLAWLESRIYMAPMPASLFIKSIERESGVSQKMRRERGKIIVWRKDAENFLNLAIKQLAKDFSGDWHVPFSVAEEDFTRATFICEGVDFPAHSKGYKPYQQDKISSFSLKNGKFEIVVESDMPASHEKLDDRNRGMKLDIFPNDKTCAAKEILFFYISQLSTMPPKVFTAERMSIPIFYKELDLNKSRFVEMLQREAYKNNRKHSEQFNRAVLRSTARYSHLISDNINATRDIEYLKKEKSDFFGDKLHGEIQSIVGGHYKHTNDQLLFIPKPDGSGKKAIPLHIASSSVQCFALLYFYLRHTAQKGQLLIIDEPEAHLDTANQIKLARLLARCVNSGLKVLITTHSDYLIKEFNNLIMLSYKPIKHKAELLKQLNYSKGDELKKEDVKAYICEKGGLTSCGIDARGMDMPVFDNTIDDINKASKTITLFLPENA